SIQTFSLNQHRLLPVNPFQPSISKKGRKEDEKKTAKRRQKDGKRTVKRRRKMQTKKGPRAESKQRISREP
ncbi:MAG: hypothetical protein ACI3Z8_07630, partial [Paludibacteraceae bacterium]